MAFILFLHVTIRSDWCSSSSVGIRTGWLYTTVTLIRRRSFTHPPTSPSLLPLPPSLPPSFLDVLGYSQKTLVLQSLVKGPATSHTVPTGARAQLEQQREFVSLAKEPHDIHMTTEHGSQGIHMHIGKQAQESHDSHVISPDKYKSHDSHMTNKLQYLHTEPSFSLQSLVQQAPPPGPSSHSSGSGATPTM